jgi:hypothetical protein
VGTRMQVISLGVELAGKPTFSVQVIKRILELFQGGKWSCYLYCRYIVKKKTGWFRVTAEERVLDLTLSDGNPLIPEEVKELVSARLSLRAEGSFDGDIGGTLFYMAQEAISPSGGYTMSFHFNSRIREQS